MSTRANSARMPFACSTRIRLCSAYCSCCARSRCSAAARCCRMPMVATSARACASIRPAVVERVRPRPQQVERTDHLLAQPHRQRVDRRVPRRARLGHERRPAVGRASGREVVAPHRLAAAVAVETRSFVVLQLEQLEQLHAVVRRRRDAQAVAESESTRPAAARSKSSTHRTVSTVRKSTMSKSATSVSADVDERPRQAITPCRHGQPPPDRDRRNAVFASRRRARGRRWVAPKRRQPARSRTKASGARRSSCSETIPAAWCTSARRVAAIVEVVPEQPRGRAVLRRRAAVGSRRRP